MLNGAPDATRKIGDNCNGIVDCGACPDGLVCGAGGPNQCGQGQSCLPLTCADYARIMPLATGQVDFSGRT